MSISIVSEMALRDMRLEYCFYQIGSSNASHLPLYSEFLILAFLLADIFHVYEICFRIFFSTADRGASP